MSAWLSILLAANSNPDRKLGRYGPLKMCCFCVMFNFWPELLWKSSKNPFSAWKLLVLLGSLQKPKRRDQKCTTLKEGLSNFVWLDRKGGLQAGTIGLDKTLVKLFSFFHTHQASRLFFASYTGPFLWVGCWVHHKLMQVDLVRCMRWCEWTGALLLGRNTVHFPNWRSQTKSNCHNTSKDLANAWEHCFEHVTDLPHP